MHRSCEALPVWFKKAEKALYEKKLLSQLINQHFENVSKSQDSCSTRPLREVEEQCSNYLLSLSVYEKNGLKRFL